MKEIRLARNKIEALKMYGVDNIYFNGNKPYGCVFGIYVYHVYAIRISNGLYEIIKEKK